MNRSIVRAARRWAAVLAILLPTSTWAKPVDQKLTALVIVTEGQARVPKDITQGIRRFFKQAASFYKEIEIRTGDKLKKKVRRRVIKCEADVECVALVGTKNKLHEIIVARAQRAEDEGKEGRTDAGIEDGQDTEDESTAETGTKEVDADGTEARRVAGKKPRIKKTAGTKVVVTFQAISSETGQIVREEKVEIASADQVQAKIARHFFDIAGITTHGYLKIQDAPSSIMVDAQSADTTAGPIRLSPGPHTVTIGDETHETMILPGETRKLTLEDFNLDSPTASTAVGPSISADSSPEGTGASDEVAAVSDTTDDAGVSTIDTILGRPLTLAGMGAGLAGAALIGVGAATAGGTTVNISSTTSQAQAERRNEDARSAASRANLMLGIGGGLLATGIAMVIVDTFVLQHDDGSGAETLSAGAESTGGGVRLWLGGRF